MRGWNRSDCCSSRDWNDDPGWNDDCDEDARDWDAKNWDAKDWDAVWMPDWNADWDSAITRRNNVG